MRKKTETTKTMRVLWLAMLALLLMTGTALRAQASDEVWDGSVASSFDGGSGTESDPYLISNGAQLAKLAQDVNGGNNYSGKYFRLTADIMLNNTEGWENWNENTKGLNQWTAIGCVIDNDKKRFSGIFDGGNHTISGIYINATTTRQGLFGCIRWSTVQNLSVTKSYINTKDSYVGGIVGMSESSNIKYCQNDATVKGKYYVGGIVGDASYVDNYVVSCLNTGKVIGPSTTIGGSIGGIVGENGGVITSCINIGSVSGENSCGEIIGHNDSSSSQVTNCYYLSGSNYKGIGSGSSGNTVEKTEEKFANGEVCWLLNNESNENPVWFQTLEIDKTPVPDHTHGTIYPVRSCPNSEINGYANKKIVSGHKDANNDASCDCCGKAMIVMQKPQFSDNAYQIGKAGELLWFAALVNGKLTDGTAQNTTAKAVLTVDIDLESEIWTPIGNESAGFMGTFDGQQHTINGMINDDSSAQYQGFVGYLGASGSIKDLALGSDCSITGGTYTGGVCGWNNGGIIAGCTNMGAVNGNGDLGGVCGHNLGTVKNCTNAGKVTNSGAETVGGICGYSHTSLIGCTNNGTVDGGGQRHVGGIVGYIDDGANGVTIQDCTNTGAITNTGDLVGGICGFGDVALTGCTNTGAVTGGGRDTGGVCGSSKGGTIQNCSNTGAITGGTQDTGGICGYTKGSVTGCYNTGSVSTGKYVGGICGYTEGGASVTNCYNTGDLSGGTYTGGVCGGNATGATIANCHNTGETVTGICGYNKSSDDSSITNCYYLGDACSSNIGIGGEQSSSIGSGIATAMTDAQFTFGAVCWLLNGSTGENVSWYQTLGQDELPVLDNTHGTVYQNGSSYSNIPPHDHAFSTDGFCTVCNLYQLAEKNENGVYEISNAGQLFWFAALVNGEKYHADFSEQDLSANGVLNADIVIPEDMDWTPMAASAVFNNSASTVAETTDKSYSGVFDGAGHKISNLNIRANEKELTSGLFGAVTGTIKNLGIESAGFDNGGAYDGRFGAVCGLLVKDSETTTEGLVQNCYVVNSSIKTKDKIAGAIVGANYGGTIANCYECGNTVEGYNRIGHLVGDNRNDNSSLSGTVSYCYTDKDRVVGTYGGSEKNSGVKSADEFKSGAVAVLLQGDQTELAWGQTIGTDEYPVLTTDEAKKVYAYSIYEGSDEAKTGYVNNGAAVSLENNAVAVVQPAGFVPEGEDVTNFIMKNGGGAYTCANLVLTDGADFYTPVAFTATEATYSRTLPETSTWGTIVLPFGATTTDANLYEATDVVDAGSEESILAVQPLTGDALEAHTPALFQGETVGTAVTFSASDAEVAATADAVLTKTIGESGYTLTGSLSTIDALAEGDLFIAKDKFWSVGTQNTVGMQAFRAYIDAPEAGPAQVNVLRILVGDATSIRQALSDGTLPVDVYNLQGVQLRKNVARDAALEGLPAGIYIVGGKKVVKK